MRTSIILLALCLALLAAPSTATFIDERNAAAQSEQMENTLVIQTNGEPVSYTITASKGAIPENESSDSIRGKTVDGRVGHNTDEGETDQEDVIKYNGYIENFDYGNEDIRVEMNGEKISPRVLSGDHLSISDERPGNSSKPLRYRFEMDGRVIPGEQAEDDDIGSGRTIRGSTHNDTDTFYFIGDLVDSSHGKDVNISVNGKYVLTNKKTSEAQTSTPNKTGKGSNPLPTNGTDSTSSSSPHSGLLVGIIGSVGLLAAVIVVGAVYFRTKSRRW